jgi:hypothetical protein
VPAPEPGSPVPGRARPVGMDGAGWRCRTGEAFAPPLGRHHRSSNDPPPATLVASR